MQPQKCVSCKIWESFQKQSNTDWLNENKEQDDNDKKKPKAKTFSSFDHYSDLGSESWHMPASARGLYIEPDMLKSTFKLR